MLVLYFFSEYLSLISIFIYIQLLIGNSQDLSILKLACIVIEKGMLHPIA